jgi:hypothetical protein
MAGMKEFLREFWRYLCEKRRLLAVYLVFVLLFCVSFWLYQLPLGAVLYPAALCGAGGLLALALGCRRQYRQRRRVEALCASPTAALLGPLPAPCDATEEAYQQLVTRLRGEYNALTDASAARYADMVDYYTLWAHQIKTPIASMRLHLQAEDSALSRQLSADLLRIEQYVEMVLMFLRLDSASTDYLFQTCDLDALVRSCIKKFAGEFIRRKVRLDYTPAAAQIVTDEKWLAFVIEQILSNALKYTPSGGTVAIYLEGGEGGAPQALCIRDTGIGIAPEDLPRIFDKGYTGWNGRADRQASGIGLYLCRRVCDALGHSLAAASAPGAGTTLRIGLARRAPGGE